LFAIPGIQNFPQQYVGYPEGAQASEEEQKLLQIRETQPSCSWLDARLILSIAGVKLTECLY